MTDDPKGVADAVPPLRELSPGVADIDRDALRIFATLTGSDVGISRGAVSVNRVPLIPDLEAREACDLDRAEVDATEAERVDKRDEGGAYEEEGSGGHGSMISTSCRDDVPNPTKSDPSSHRQGETHLYKLPIHQACNP